MSINTVYYNDSAGWVVMNDSQTFEPFYVPQWAADVPTYGRSGATQYNIKFAQAYPTYYKNTIDRSVCWCATDGTESWSDTTWYSATTATATEPISMTSSSTSSIGLGLTGNTSAYVNNGEYFQFFKSSSTGNSLTNPLLNYDVNNTNLSIDIRSYNNDTEYIGVPGSGISPVTRMNFNTIVLVPIIEYYTFKEGKTLADYLACTTSSEISSVLNSSMRCDLASYCNEYNGTIVGNDNHIISYIGVLAKQVRWNDDKTFAEDRIGSSTNTTGVISPLVIDDNNSNVLEWTDWYNTTNPKSYSLMTNVSLSKTYKRAPGNITLWNDSTSSKNNGQFSNFSAIILEGNTYSSGSGYNSNQGYRYNLYQVCRGKNFHCKSIQYQNSAYKKAYQVYFDWTEKFSDIEAFREYVRKQVAYFGMYFSDSFHTYTWTSDLDGTNVMLGIIDDSGITHGTYSSGTANKNQRQADWGDDPYSKTPYNPNKPGPSPENDPNKYNSGMATPISRSFASATTLYAGDGAEVNTIMWFCSKVKNVENFTNIDDMNLWLQRNFLTSNPIDNIISCKWFPFDTADFMGMGAKGNVKLGNTFVNVSGDYKTAGLQMYTSLSPTQVNTLYLGHFELLSAYDSYRDYSPYTDASLYFPYCGTIPLDVSYCVGHTIWIQYKIDINTGSCTAIASLDSYDGDIIGTGHGTISIDIPLSGVAQANYQNGIYNGIANIRSQQLNTRQSNFNNASKIVSGAVGTITAGVSGDVGGAIGSAAGTFSDVVNSSFTRERQEMNMEKARYSLKTTPVERVIIGNSSAADGSINYQYPAILITRSPIYDDVGNMTYISDLQGYSTCLYTSLGSVSGYTVCSDVHCVANNGWTEEEISATIAMLNSGVYM